jgi:hypothetical protein
LTVAAANAGAGQTDPADLAFWQAVQNSTNPAEYKAYLEAFPNGRFSALARVRMASPPPAAAPDAAAPGTTAPPAQAPTATPAAGPAVPPTPAAQPPRAPTPAANLGPVAGGGRVKLLAQASYPLGEPITIRFSGLPRGENNTLRILPAESPNAIDKSIQTQWIYTQNRDGALPDSNTGQIAFQPLAPGNYQAVLVSKIFNNAGKDEIVARAAFTVD